MPQEKGVPRKLELRQRKYNTLCRSLQNHHSNDYYIACAVTSNIQLHYQNVIHQLGMKQRLVWIWVVLFKFPFLPFSLFYLLSSKRMFLYEADSTRLSMVDWFFPESFMLSRCEMQHATLDLYCSSSDLLLCPSDNTKLNHSSSRKELPCRDLLSLRILRLRKHQLHSHLCESSCRYTQQARLSG
jgi:hypothetical protein